MNSEFGEIDNNSFVEVEQNRDRHSSESMQDQPKAMTKAEVAPLINDLIGTANKLRRKTNDELKNNFDFQVRQLSARFQVEGSLPVRNELTAIESLLLSLLGISGIEMPSERPRISDLAKKPIITFCLEHDADIFSINELLDFSLEKSGKSYRSSICFNLRNRRSKSDTTLGPAVLNRIIHLWSETSAVDLSKWIDEVVFNANIAVPVEDGARLLVSTYERIANPSSSSSGSNRLVYSVISWLMQSQNDRFRDGYVETAGESMTAASFAILVKSMRKIPLEINNPKFHFLKLLTKSNSRGTIRTFSQEGVLEAFQTTELAVFLSDREVEQVIRSNERVLGVFVDDARKRIRKCDISEGHQLVLRYPILFDLIGEKQILSKFRPEVDPLSQLFFHEGRRDALLQTQEEINSVIAPLRETIEVQKKDLETLNSKVQESEMQARELEEKLRRSRVATGDARNDQIRLAQLDILRKFIISIDEIEIAAENPDSLKTAIVDSRKNLASLGITQKFERNQNVPLDYEFHDAPDLTLGTQVRVVTPAYLIYQSNEVVVLRKAKVIPIS